MATLITVHAAHVAAAALAFAAALVSAAATFRGAPAPRTAYRDYVTLTKPRIMSLLLLTGLAGMFVGAGGVPTPWLALAAMTGLALACGGASAVNHVLDRDIDRLMGARTRARPLAAERMPPSRALEFGLTLSALSFVLLASVVNVLTAALALAGNLDPAAARQAFTAAFAHLLPGAPVPDMPAGGTWRDLDACWPVLDGLARLEKRLLVEAMVVAVLDDGKLGTEEAELLRAACALVHVPLPALVA
jgi:hypothetical protein